MEETAKSGRLSSVEPCCERERVARRDGVSSAERVAWLQAENSRLAFLDALSVQLAEAAAEADVLAAVTRLAAPALGEWAGVFLPGESGDLELAMEAGPPAVGRATAAHVRDDPRRTIGRAGEGEAPALLEVEVQGAAGTVVACWPLAVAGRPLGVLALAARAEGARDPHADRVLGAEVARRAALALDHARLLRDATLAAQAREEFLHVASHELRGPVGTLHLTLQLLARDVRKGAYEAAEGRLRAVDRQAQRLVRLSETLLDVSRITAGRLALAREPGDLAALVREVAARAAAQAADAGIEVRVDAPAPVPCLFDAARMDQVVTNLLSNAVKYGRGRPVRVAVSAAGGRPRLAVEDEGIGIAPEDQERIFGRFERAVSSRHFGGLGLGLWIVQRLVEAHGGHIVVRSAPGAGSTFVVELPP